MKLLLNCDQVFEVLTRGPFPSGEASDEQVESHLRACHECRRLAEALRPAVELMHESLGPNGGIDLPEYQGVLSAIEQNIAIQQPRRAPLHVRQLSRQMTPESRRFDSTQILGAIRMVAAVVLIAAVGTLMWGLATTSRDAAIQNPGFAGLTPQGAKPPIRLDDRGLLTLASLNLPAVCFPREALVAANPGQTPPAPIAATAKEQLQCCTLCHRAMGQSRRPSDHMVATLMKSCSACHSL